MTRISATEFKNNIGKFSDTAMRGEPVIVTSHNRDRLVLISAEDYKRLVGEEEALSPEVEELIEARLNKHRDTIVDLANR